MCLSIPSTFIMFGFLQPGPLDISFPSKQWFVCLLSRKFWHCGHKEYIIFFFSVHFQNYSLHFELAIFTKIYLLVLKLLFAKSRLFVSVHSCFVCGKFCRCFSCLDSHPFLVICTYSIAYAFIVSNFKNNFIFIK